MENQHRMITGYRDLSEQEIAAMNEVKAVGSDLESLVHNLESQGVMVDQRWIAIGKTHLQQGLMALVRAVARPDSF